MLVFPILEFVSLDDFFGGGDVTFFAGGLVPSGEVDDVGGEEGGVGAGPFREVNLLIVAGGGDRDVIPKFFEAEAVLLEFRKAGGAIFDEVKIAERSGFEGFELAQSEFGLPVGDGGVGEEFSVGGTFNPFELEQETEPRLF